MGVFRKKMNADASAYYVADEQAIKDEYCYMAKLRNCSLPVGTPVDQLDFRAVMPVGMAEDANSMRNLGGCFKVLRAFMLLMLNRTQATTAVVTIWVHWSLMAASTTLS